MNPVDQFRDALVRRGLVPPDQIEADGKLHRCDAKGKKGQRDGAYVLRPDGYPQAVSKTGEMGFDWEDWFPDTGRRL